MDGSRKFTDIPKTDSPLPMSPRTSSDQKRDEKVKPQSVEPVADEKGKPPSIEIQRTDSPLPMSPRTSSDQKRDEKVKPQSVEPVADYTSTENTSKNFGNFRKVFGRRASTPSEPKFDRMLTEESKASSHPEEGDTVPPLGMPRRATGDREERAKRNYLKNAFGNAKRKSDGVNEDGIPKGKGPEDLTLKAPQPLPPSFLPKGREESSTMGSIGQRDMFSIGGDYPRAYDQYSPTSPLNPGQPSNSYSEGTERPLPRSRFSPGPPPFGPPWVSSDYAERPPTRGKFSPPLRSHSSNTYSDAFEPSSRTFSPPPRSISRTPNAFSESERGGSNSLGGRTNEKKGSYASDDSKTPPQGNSRRGSWAPEGHLRRNYSSTSVRESIFSDKDDSDSASDNTSISSGEDDLFGARKKRVHVIETISGESHKMAIEGRFKNFKGYLHRHIESLFLLRNQSKRLTPELGEHSDKFAKDDYLETQAEYKNSNLLSSIHRDDLYSRLKPLTGYEEFSAAERLYMDGDRDAAKEALKDFQEKLRDKSAKPHFLASDGTMQMHTIDISDGTEVVRNVSMDNISGVRGLNGNKRYLPNSTDSETIYTYDIKYSDPKREEYAQKYAYAETGVKNPSTSSSSKDIGEDAYRLSIRYNKKHIEALNRYDDLESEALNSYKSLLKSREAKTGGPSTIQYRHPVERFEFSADEDDVETHFENAVSEFSMVRGGESEKVTELIVKARFESEKVKTAEESLISAQKNLMMSRGNMDDEGSSQTAYDAKKDDYETAVTHANETWEKLAEEIGSMDKEQAKAKYTLEERIHTSTDHDSIEIYTHKDGSSYEGVRIKIDKLNFADSKKEGKDLVLNFKNGEVLHVGWFEDMRETVRSLAKTLYKEYIDLCETRIAGLIKLMDKTPSRANDAAINLAINTIKQQDKEQEHIINFISSRPSPKRDEILIPVLHEIKKLTTMSSHEIMEMHNKGIAGLLSKLDSKREDVTHKLLTIANGNPAAREIVGKNNALMHPFRGKGNHFSITTRDDKMYAIAGKFLEKKIGDSNAPDHLANLLKGITPETRSKIVQLSINDAYFEHAFEHSFSARHEAVVNALHEYHDGQHQLLFTKIASTIIREMDDSFPAWLKSEITIQEKDTPVATSLTKGSTTPEKAVKVTIKEFLTSENVSDAEARKMFHAAAQEYVKMPEGTDTTATILARTLNRHFDFDREDQSKQMIENIGKSIDESRNNILKENIAIDTFAQSRIGDVVTGDMAIDNFLKLDWNKGEVLEKKAREIIKEAAKPYAYISSIRPHIIEAGFKAYYYDDEEFSSAEQSMHKAISNYGLGDALTDRLVTILSREIKASQQIWLEGKEEITVKDFLGHKNIIDEEDIGNLFDIIPKTSDVIDWFKSKITINGKDTTIGKYLPQHGISEGEARSLYLLYGTRDGADNAENWLNRKVTSYKVSKGESQEGEKEEITVKDFLKHKDITDEEDIKSLFDIIPKTSDAADWFKSKITVKGKDTTVESYLTQQGIVNEAKSLYQVYGTREAENWLDRKITSYKVSKGKNREGEKEEITVKDFLKHKDITDEEDIKILFDIIPKTSDAADWFKSKITVKGKDTTVESYLTQQGIVNEAKSLYQVYGTREAENWLDRKITSYKVSKGKNREGEKSEDSDREGRLVSRKNYLAFRGINETVARELHGNVDRQTSHEWINQQVPYEETGLSGNMATREAYLSFRGIKKDTALLMHSEGSPSRYDLWRQEIIPADDITMSTYLAHKDIIINEATEIYGTVEKIDYEKWLRSPVPSDIGSTSRITALGEYLDNKGLDEKGKRSLYASIPKSYKTWLNDRDLDSDLTRKQVFVNKGYSEETMQRLHAQELAAMPDKESWLNEKVKGAVSKEDTIGALLKKAGVSEEAIESIYTNVNIPKPDFDRWLRIRINDREGNRITVEDYLEAKGLDVKEQRSIFESIHQASDAKTWLNDGMRGGTITREQHLDAQNLSLTERQSLFDSIDQALDTETWLKSVMSAGKGGKDLTVENFLRQKNLSSDLYNSVHQLDGFTIWQNRTINVADGRIVGIKDYLAPQGYGEKERQSLLDSISQKEAGDDAAWLKEHKKLIDIGLSKGEVTSIYGHLLRAEESAKWEHKIIKIPGRVKIGTYLKNKGLDEGDKRSLFRSITSTPDATAWLGSDISRGRGGERVARVKYLARKGIFNGPKDLLNFFESIPAASNITEWLLTKRTSGGISETTGDFLKRSGLPQDIYYSVRRPSMEAWENTKLPTMPHTIGEYLTSKSYNAKEKQILFESIARTPDATQWLNNKTLADRAMPLTITTKERLISRRAVDAEIEEAFKAGYELHFESISDKDLANGIKVISHNFAKSSLFTNEQADGLAKTLRKHLLLAGQGKWNIADAINRYIDNPAEATRIADHLALERGIEPTLHDTERWLRTEPGSIYKDFGQLNQLWKNRTTLDVIHHKMLIGIPMTELHEYFDRLEVTEESALEELPSHLPKTEESVLAKLRKNKNKGAKETLNQFYMQKEEKELTRAQIRFQNQWVLNLKNAYARFISEPDREEDLHTVINHTNAELARIDNDRIEILEVLKDDSKTSSQKKEMLGSINPEMGKALKTVKEEAREFDDKMLVIWKMLHKNANNLERFKKAEKEDVLIGQLMSGAAAGIDQLAVLTYEKRIKDCLDQGRGQEAQELISGKNSRIAEYKALFTQIYKDEVANSFKTKMMKFTAKQANKQLIQFVILFACANGNQSMMGAQQCFDRLNVRLFATGIK